MSLTSYVIMKGNDYQTICNYIRKKTKGTETYTSSQVASKIGELLYENPVATREKNVNFIDYDGTMLYSYTLTEIQKLTELPALPEHKGLVCQGWNWTLDGLKALNRDMTVGAMYITDDGKTRLHIHIEEPTSRVYVNFEQTVASGVVVDFGDGYYTSDSSNTFYASVNHTYLEAGDYIITLNVVDGSLYIRGLSHSSSVHTQDSIQCFNMLKSVNIGNGVTDLGGSFDGNRCLSTITIPNTVNDISSAFRNCRSLKSIILPNSINTTGRDSASGDVFSNCYSLSIVSLPETLTEIIGTYLFNNCNLHTIDLPNGIIQIKDCTFSNCASLYKIFIPSSVNKIASTAFENCAVYIYDFSSHTTIPTLGSNALGDINKIGCIYVPSSLYSSWTTATNWSQYANRMVSV